jgi:hypothetical protein
LMLASRTSRSSSCVVPTPPALDSRNPSTPSPRARALLDSSPPAVPEGEYEVRIDVLPAGSLLQNSLVEPCARHDSNVHPTRHMGDSIIAPILGQLHSHWRRVRRVASINATRVVRTAAPKSTLTFHLGSRGRLGNQLFQIAGTIGLAASMDVDAVFHQRWTYRPYVSLPDRFFGDRLTIARSSEAWPLAVAIDEKARVYLQHLDLWNACRGEIHRWLQPSERAREAAAEKYSGLLAFPCKTAVHVRRGDLLTNPSHQPCPASYYEQAVELARTENPSTQFLVFSDDIEWCHRNLGIPEAHFVGGNPDWLDLTLMSQCEHHICANSTFSWWGAFLSTDPSPIVPWLTGVAWPLRMRHPEGWREIEIIPDG